MTNEAPERPELNLPAVVRPFIVVAMFVVVMWAVELIDLLPHTPFDAWGIQPRTSRGLVGIVTAPFLHAGFGHLIGNTVPFLVLGCIIAMSGVRRYLEVTAIVMVVAGLGAWLTGPSHTDHIGASGLVFGYVTFLLARGVFERKMTYLAGGLVVLFLYGGVLWGLLPKPGISWQGHIFGAIGGVVAARVLHSGAVQARQAAASQP